MQIFSCKGCVPPERYPGCHGKCEKYLAEKATYAALKEADDKRKRVLDGLLAQREQVYYRAMKKNRRGNKRYE